MDDMTRSENRFVGYCRSKGLKPHRIDRADYKTPDFELGLGNLTVAVEVKELCPNALDKATWHKVSTRGTAAEYCSAENRVREKIMQACKQLKRRTQKMRPGLLIVYDNGTFGGIDYTDIKNAMYGSEAWRITEYEDYTEIVPRLGAGQMCTANQNTTLSALCLLTSELVCFHNVHAACPVRPDEIRALCDRQFTIDLNDVERLPGWSEC